MSDRDQVLALFHDHAQAWRPLLVQRHGQAAADCIAREARKELERIIPTIPDIGGDANPMTRHLRRSVTSLALYLAMRRSGHSAEEAGWVIYHAVAARVATLPRQAFDGLTQEQVAAKREEAARSRQRRYPGDWVWEFVEGDGGRTEYGYDFLQCGTQKLYRAHGAEEFLPFYCYLDFVTHRAEGWGFSRTKTLAQGHDRCDFRYRRGEGTACGWPPPFLRDSG
ncbi:MAG: L-2-amino-thiazoline-4-carboxylic acid hydrolase [Anaerolineae bacterium]|nr:L-2-amino-thiazoline-4-carboxylic acid hydrolase [Anaerolineae bacterium]